MKRGRPNSRRGVSKRAKSTSRKSGRLLTQFSRTTIEARVQDLESRVAALERLCGPPQLDWAQKKKTKPGPAERIPEGRLLQLRDGLVTWLETVWPELGPRLLGATNEAGVVLALQKNPNPTGVAQEYEERLLQNAAMLLEFLRSDKFRRKPSKRAVKHALDLLCIDSRQATAANKFPTRQIANAMAGVPELAWRTSLDYCGRSPAELAVAPELEQHYRSLYGLKEPASDTRGQADPR